MTDERIFTDELIPARGERFTARRADGEALPARLAEMLALGVRLEAEGAGEAEIFRRQAELVADFEYEGSSRAWFSAYYPTYTMMSGPQLLAYFTWRTRWKMGERPRSFPSSFAFLHVYELLNGAGADSPRDAWERLERFWQEVRPFDFTLDRYVPGWLDDLVVFHGLPAALLRPKPFDQKYRRNRSDPEGAGKVVQALASGGSFTDERMRDLAWYELLARSSYSPQFSSFWKGNEEAVRGLALETLARLGSRAIEWFGSFRSVPRKLFESAVFDASVRPEDRVYQAGDTFEWRCTGGEWTVERYSLSSKKHEGPKALLRNVEAALRARADDTGRFRATDPTGYIRPVIDAILAERDAAARAAANPARKIDFSRLTGIRADAAAVEERLIVDAPEDDPAGEPAETSRAITPVPRSEPPEPEKFEEKEAPAEACSSAPGTDAPVVHHGVADAVAAAGDENPVGLTEAERTFLRALLEGRFEAGLLPGGASPEIVTDEINGKLFDEIGDAVLEFDGAGIRVIEDYVEDLAALL
ncbi:TerB N-terminal domain-containing protein [Sutterella sp.]|uniref:TerB N-terminal domain-containing protein n=1 Tax=Sutterella sp. TaxID=1981025 RepID=UPI0026DF0E88|nr:TerB N-terminal domain-containing protein [Sutterella sp.]MDO5532788.1 TerB N-terminal domain-containing protein [Sutterella sp.]